MCHRRAKAAVHLPPGPGGAWEPLGAGRVLLREPWGQQDAGLWPEPEPDAGRLVLPQQGLDGGRARGLERPQVPTLPMDRLLRAGLDGGCSDWHLRF